jgi:hypothetical protein
MTVSPSKGQWAILALRKVWRIDLDQGEDTPVLTWIKAWLRRTCKKLTVEKLLTGAESAFWC